MVEDGRLPPPVYGGRMPLWSEAALDESGRAAALIPRPPKRDVASRKQRERTRGKQHVARKSQLNALLTPPDTAVS
jgi:hypothetical protein